MHNVIKKVKLNWTEYLCYVIMDTSPKDIGSDCKSQTFVILLKNMLNKLADLKRSAFWDAFLFTRLLKTA